MNDLWAVFTPWSFADFTHDESEVLSSSQRHRKILTENRMLLHIQEEATFVPADRSVITDFSVEEGDEGGAAERAGRVQVGVV